MLLLQITPWMVFKTSGILLALGLAAFFYRLVQVRLMTRRIQKKHGIVRKQHLIP